MAEIPELDAAAVTAVVQAALGDADYRPVSWSIEPLGVALVNPATTGLFRVQGQARAGTGQRIPWQAVLKVVSDLDPDDADAVGYTRGEGDWNYWKRELLVRRSGILDAFGGPFLPVRCYGVAEPAPGQGFIWMEYLDSPSPRPRWSVTELAASAHHLGVFAVQGIERVEELDTHSWAARHWLRSWLATMRKWGAQDAADNADCWNHPLLSACLGSTTAARFSALLDEADDILNVLERFPLTVAHHDAQWSNLFKRESADPSRDTVAIDWSFLGLAPVGQDLGHHIGCNIYNRAVAPTEAALHDEASTAAYIAGLRESGWRGDERTVRLSRSAGAALQMAPFYSLDVASLSTDAADAPNHDDEIDYVSWPETLAQRLQETVEVAMTGWAAGFAHVLDMGDEARRLAELLC